MLPSNLAFIKRRMAQAVRGRGSLVHVHWKHHEGELDETTGAALDQGTPRSGVLYAIGLAEAPRTILRQFQEIQAGDLIMDLVPDPMVTVASKPAIDDPEPVEIPGAGEDYVGSTIFNGDQYDYKISYVTAEGETAVSEAASLGTDFDPDKALRLNFESPSSGRVIAIRIWRNRTDAGSVDALLAELEPSAAFYLDTETHAQFSTRSTAVPVLPVVNTTAVGSSEVPLSGVPTPRFQWGDVMYSQAEMSEELAQMWSLRVQGHNLLGTILLRRST